MTQNTTRKFITQLFLRAESESFSAVTFYRDTSVHVDVSLSASRHYTTAPLELWYSLVPMLVPSEVYQPDIEQSA